MQHGPWHGESARRSYPSVQSRFPASSLTLTYDTNGNLTEERVIGGSTRIYQWDSLNRLIAIQSDKVPVPGSWRTEFAYDGQSRRVGIVEKIREDSGWTTESSARYLWEGTEIIQKRDASGSTVTAKYFDQGEIRVFGSSTIPYYFTRDHLGSVREVVNQGGVIAQSFDYTAWGERTSSTAGALEWGFTGHHYHEKSGLCLAMFRAYDANLGRWLSEDPIGEAGGLNLYGYVGRSPISSVDTLGLSEGLVGNAIEMAGGVASVGPGNAWYASHGLAEEARRFSKLAASRAVCKGKTQNPDWYRNAARHAYWQGRLTQRHGSLNADLVGIFHESGTTDLRDSWVDRYNNRVAQRIGDASSDSGSLVRNIVEALDEGRFITDPCDSRIPSALRGLGRQKGDSGSGNDSEEHHLNGSGGSAGPRFF